MLDARRDERHAEVNRLHHDLVMLRENRPGLQLGDQGGDGRRSVAADPSQSLGGAKGQRAVLVFQGFGQGGHGGHGFPADFAQRLRRVLAQIGVVPAENFHQIPVIR